MIRSGLVSITFRQLSPARIVALCQEAGVQGIEWGGDVHVPHGELATAERVAALTRDAGLCVPTYGSYYRVGTNESGSDALTFLCVLDTALALGAPAVRVWAGDRDSADADEQDWGRILADLARICQLASEQKLRIVMEYHGGTLNDTAASSRRLLDHVAADRLSTLWQTTNGKDVAYCRETLSALLDRVLHVHVFNWGTGKADQGALSDAGDAWADYLELLQRGDRERFALIEYVKDDKPEQFLADAAVLRGWLGEA